MEDYVKDLNGDYHHVFVEQFHSQIGNMYYKLQKPDKALVAFERLLGCKERQHGPNSKELIGPMMQTQHMSSSLPDVKASLEKCGRANKLIDAVVSEMDNKLVMDAGNLQLAEKIKIEQEMSIYQKYKIDVLFTLHNLHKIEGQYAEALTYAKEHTSINAQIYKKKHKCYAYALLLEAQTMSLLPNLDQSSTLEKINEALQVQLKAGEGKPVDSLLGRIYEEKGHILKGIGGVENDAKALQAFNSAQAIMIKSGETQRLEVSQRMIEEISVKTGVVESMNGKNFDTDFLTEAQKGQFVEEDEEQEAEVDTDSQTTLLLATFGVLAVGAFAYFKLKK